jgi:hypothetical protein
MDIKPQCEYFGDAIGADVCPRTVTKIVYFDMRVNPSWEGHDEDGEGCLCLCTECETLAVNEAGYIRTEEWTGWEHENKAVKQIWNWRDIPTETPHFSSPVVAPEPTVEV